MPCATTIAFAGHSESGLIEVDGIADGQRAFFKDFGVETALMDEAREDGHGGELREMGARFAQAQTAQGDAADEKIKAGMEDGNVELRMRTARGGPSARIK